MCRRDASTIAKAAKLLRRPELADAADSVLTADVDLRTAVVVGGEYDKLAPDLTDEAKPVVLDQLLAIGADAGPAGVRTLKQEIFARYGEDGEFEKHQDKLPPADRPVPGPGDLPRGLGLPADHGQRRPLRAGSGDRAAVRTPGRQDADGDRSANPTSAPVGRRRGEALIEALRRSVTVTDPDTGDPPPTPRPC